MNVNTFKGRKKLDIAYFKVLLQAEKILIKHQPVYQSGPFLEQISELCMVT